MAVLHPVPVRSDRFTWHPGTRTYAAEISDLGGRFGRVYDDSCDEGLTLVSHNGRELVLVVNHTERRDGDTLWWDLVPADFKSCGFSVRVYND